jgi:hypothetical protein
MLDSRIVRIALATAIGIAIGATQAHAQNEATPARVQDADSAVASQSRWEFRFTSGKLVPTGTQRDVLEKQSGVSAAQLTYVMHQNVAVTGTFGWARSRDIATSGEPRLDLFTYDVGTELRANTFALSKSSTVRPFAGVGAGGRTYNYRSLDVDATHNVAAYGSVGSELGVKRVHTRIEVRDYVTRFKPLTGAGASDTRNDVSVLIGIAVSSR